MGKRVHLGVSGSVATFKTLTLLREILRTNMSVGATLTKGAQQFITGLSFEALGAAPVYSGMFPPEPDLYGHLEPAQNADVLVVAPATANIIAKMANGLADDMLSCQALAFSGPIIVAPAMNYRMWQAPATQENWQRLKERGVVCIEPCAGLMACGEEGDGRFPALTEIFCEILRAVSPQDMAGKKVLVTLGPTSEPFDAVRRWTNPSTGTMGAAMAVAAWLRGADVTAVCGPVSLDLPTEMTRVDVQTAREMQEACNDLWPTTDYGCCTAAVADFRPVPLGEGTETKMKKDAVDSTFTVFFEQNPDILAGLGVVKKDGQRLIGLPLRRATCANMPQVSLNGRIWTWLLPTP